MTGTLLDDGVCIFAPVENFVAGVVSLNPIDGPVNVRNLVFFVFGNNVFIASHIEAFHLHQVFAVSLNACEDTIQEQVTIIWELVCEMSVVSSSLFEE